MTAVNASKKFSFSWSDGDPAQKCTRGRRSMGGSKSYFPRKSIENKGKLVAENLVFIQADTIDSRRKCYGDRKVRLIPKV